MKLDQIKKELEKQGYCIEQASKLQKGEIISTGIFAIDEVLGGGIYFGVGGHRIELWGAESTGKSTVALKIIASYQKLGKKCVYVDGEHSFDGDWAQKLGVDVENLLMIYPTSLEELGDMLAILIKKVDLIVIDSIVSIIPESEIDRNTNEPTMALQARVNALITRKIYQALANRPTTLVFINQLREKVGIQYGDPNTSGGGHALLHLYNTRLQFKRGAPIDKGSGDNKERIGYEINIKCIKNKRGVPYKQTVLDMYFDGNFDNKKSLFYSALKYGVIEKSGHTYSFDKTKIVGKDNFIEKFDNWTKLEKELQKVIRKLK